MDTTLRIIRGDTLLLNLEIADNSVPVDITGYTFFVTVKRKLKDEDEDALIAKDWSTHTDAEGGLTEIELSPDDTDIPPGNYYFDIQMKTADNKIVSTEHGTLEVVQDVTSRTDTDE